MQLYGFHLCGHSHRAKRLLPLLNVPYEAIEIGIPARTQKSEAHWKRNPFGQVPVLVDGDAVNSDSNAIRIYLAKKYGPTTWPPESPRGADTVRRGLSVAAGEVANGPAVARAINVPKAPRKPQEFIARPRAPLGIFDTWMRGRRQVASIPRTIPDMALYRDIARVRDGDVGISHCPEGMDWLARMASLAGFAPFRRTAVAPEAVR